MGFFRNLWDESLASDSGIRMSRRYDSLISRYNNYNYNYNNPPPANVDITTPVSRSITIVRNTTLSDSPSGSSPSAAGSPFSATSSPCQDFKKLTRRKSTGDRREPKSPTGYDWIVLSSLDR